MQTTRTSSWLLRAGMFVLVAGCALFNPPSKVKSGQLFETGQAPYDDYFTKVHALQLEAANWPDAKKAARRNLIDELKIATDAPEVTIAQATHERMVAIAHVVGSTRLDLRDDDAKLVLASESRGDASVKDFTKALMGTIDAELKRKKEMHDVPPKCDELAKTGRELEPRVKTDFVKNGGTAMADVHDELQASFDVLEQISTTARLGARETEDFVADMQRAIAAEPSEPLPGTSATSSGAKPPSTGSHPKPPPVAHTETKPKPPAAKPKPKPKPQGGGGGDEVFNP
jgi:hypothetical protein